MRSEMDSRRIARWLLLPVLLVALGGGRVCWCPEAESEHPSHGASSGPAGAPAARLPGQPDDAPDGHHALPHGQTHNPTEPPDQDCCCDNQEPLGAEPCKFPGRQLIELPAARLMTIAPGRLAPASASALEPSGAVGRWRATPLFLLECALLR